MSHLFYGGHTDIQEQRLEEDCQPAFLFALGLRTADDMTVLKIVLQATRLHVYHITWLLRVLTNPLRPHL